MAKHVYVVCAEVGPDHHVVVAGATSEGAEAV